MATLNSSCVKVVYELDEGYEIQLDESGEIVSIRGENLDILFAGAAREDIEQQ